MGSTDNGIALRAVRELRAHGWLEDESLRGADIIGANLQGRNYVGWTWRERHFVPTCEELTYNRPICELPICRGRTY